MTDRERVKLLFGPYKAPPLRRGDRARCLYRDAEVVIAGWKDALIPWPLCYIAEGRARAHGLLVDEELARAIRHESAAAVAHSWGVCKATVQHWRAALGVGRMDAEGSRRLILAATKGAGNARHVRGNVGRRPDVPWTPEHVALFGVLPDAEIAGRTGRSVQAVAAKRRRTLRAKPTGQRGDRGNAR
jgi:hypothetical protein